MQKARIVILNTLILYGRLIIGMVLGLISTRIILGALGEINYGIYVLIAGVIGMLGILNSSMINTSLRFITHSIGTKNEDQINKTFTTTILLHFLIGLVIIILMEIGGYFIFKYFLNIPTEKIWDAKIIFHFMVLTTYVTVISVPFDALINANEKIFALALVDLLGSVFNLLSAIYLTYSSGNLLVVYGGLVLGNQIILRIVKQVYIKRNFSGYKVDFKKYFDKKILWSILSYSSWNILGSIASISVVQIKSIFINNFFGVKVNAANGIASTVSSQVNQVATSMTGAIYPQLVKSEGSGDRMRMIRITVMATKFSVFLFSILALPVVFETNFLLTIWLKNVPQYTVVICQIILINLLLEKMTFEINTAIRAVGDIRKFQIFESAILILNIPFGYILLKYNFGIYSIFFTSLIISVFVGVIRLYFGYKVVGINILNYLNSAVYPIIIPVFLASIVSIIPYFLISEGVIRLLIIVFLSIFVTSTTFWRIGLLDNEKKILLSFIKR